MGASISIDLRVAELLASRICHDLVGPVSAVNNGMELLQEEMTPGEAADAVRLASDSAAQSAAVLQFYRLAFGMAGSREPPSATELRRVAEAFLARGKVRLDWPETPLPGNAPHDTGKLLLNMLALGVEGLPRGGTLALSAAAVGAGIEARVAASGERAGLREESQAALSDDVPIEELTPRNVQGYFAALLARRLGGRLALERASPDAVTLSATVDSASVG